MPTGNIKITMVNDENAGSSEDRDELKESKNENEPTITGSINLSKKETQIEVENLKVLRDHNIEIPSEVEVENLKVSSPEDNGEDPPKKTGYVHLSIYEFHNPHRDTETGRFDDGPDGPGRLREIIDPRKRDKAESEAKKAVKDQKEVQGQKDKVALLEDSKKDAEKEVKNAGPESKEAAQKNLDSVNSTLEKESSKLREVEKEAGLFPSSASNLEPKTIQDVKDSAINRESSLAAEDQLEKLRGQAFERNEKAEAENDKEAFKESSKELNELNNALKHVRKDAYDVNVRSEINEYDEIAVSSHILKTDSKFGDRQSQDILGGGEAWANDEKAKLQAEARGKKLPEVRQTIGQKEGDWPDPAGIAPGVEGRKIEQIARGGLIRTVEVDGIDVKSAYEVTTSDGTKIRVYDMASRKQQPHVKDVANSAAYMHELYPNDPAKGVILVSDMQMRALSGGSAFAGVFPGSQHVYVNTSLAGPQTRIERAVANRQWNNMVESGWVMPSSHQNSKNHYTMVHEWGHQYDFTNRRSSAKEMYQTPEVKKHLSNYGRSDLREGYAESFAEWHLSQGQTKNPAARAYAKYEKWHGHDRASGTRTEAKATGPRVGGQDRRIVRTPEGADRFGVPIGSSIPTGDDETSTLDPVQLTSREADLELAIKLGIIHPIPTNGETMVQFQEDSGDESKKDEDSGDESKKDKESSGEDNEEEVTLPSEDLVKKVPGIFDYFDGKKHADVKKFPEESKASEVNRKEAEKIARKAFDELGVEFE